MKSDELINILSVTTPSPRASVALLPSALGIVVLSAAAIILTYGVRPDIMSAVTTAHFWYKTLFLMALAACSALALQRSLLPASTPDKFINALCALWIVTSSVAMLEVFFFDRNLLEETLISSNTLFCLGYISALGVLAMVGLTFIAKQFAPIHARTSATLIGFSAGVLVALGYSFHCMADFGSYLLVAYGAPIFALTYVGRHLLPSFLKW